MNPRKLGCTGLFVSDLCLGTMNFGMADWGVDERTGLDVIAAYFDGGGNFLDTADVYSAGLSERICAKAMKGRRDRVVLATKGHFPVVERFGEPPAHINAAGSSRRHLTLALEDSLRRLETDYVDLYQVHCWDAHTPIEETLATLDAFVKSGKVRYVGLSNFDAWQIAESRQLCIRHGWEPFVTAQMQYSLACRDIERGVVPVCRKYGIGLLPWSPLGGGVLTGKYRGTGPADAGTRFGAFPDENNDWRRAFLNERNLHIGEAVRQAAEALHTNPSAVALQWLLRQPMVSSIIIGPKSVGQLKDNLAASELALPADVMANLGEVSKPHLPYPEKFIARNARNMFAPDAP